MGKPKLTDEDKRNIVELVSRGANKKDVSIQYGISETYVGIILYRSMHPNLRSLRELTIDDWDNITKLVATGFKTNDIAAMYNVDKKLLCNTLHNRGIEIKKSREYKEEMNSTLEKMDTLKEGMEQSFADDFSSYINCR